MMTKKQATEVQKYALEAVTSLTRILNSNLQQDSPREFEKIKIGVASAIGTIQIKILEVINHAHPDLDDLRRVSTSKEVKQVKK